MKIKRLWVSKYKNIPSGDLIFNSDLITLLVGQNGLGKSNLLEVIALIFRDLDLLQTEEEFKDWPYDPYHFEYEIDYECKNLDIRIQSFEGLFRFSVKDIGDEDNFKLLDFGNFKRNKQKLYLPDYIIGYYSGENKRIKSIIKIHEDLLIKDLKGNKGLEDGFRRLFFAENYHGPLVLLTLLMYYDHHIKDGFHLAVQTLLSRFSNFVSLEEFTIQLKNPKWYNRNNPAHEKWGIDELEANITSGNFAFWNVKGKANDILSFFYDSITEPPIYYYDEKLFDEGYEIIELNSINPSKIKSTIKEKFATPLDFFDAFESLELVDIISSIHIKIKSQTNDVLFDFRQLSEGEQQLITVLGLIMITGQADCLFLLDEPDTHLNPKWQRDYVGLLHESNLNGNNSHMIVATHSPLIVQSAEHSDILLYKVDENGKTEILNNKDLQIHNWRIDQVLASEFFGFDSTRPPQLDGYMKLREKILSEGILSEDIQRELQKLENEFGVLPTGETIDELKSILLVKSLANKLK